MRELTPAADAPPTKIPSGSMPFFLNSPFSSATQILPLMGLTELRPIRKRSAAALLLHKKQRIQAERTMTTFLNISNRSANRLDDRKCIASGPHRQKYRVAVFAAEHDNHDIFRPYRQMNDPVRGYVRRFSQ